MTWCGDSTASTVTADAPPAPRARSPAAATGCPPRPRPCRSVNFPGWPRVERSSWPGMPPSTLMMSSRSARPIVALARLPLPSTLCVAFMPRRAPDRAVHHHERRAAAGARGARRAGRTSARTWPARRRSPPACTPGRHPAITAAMATFSAVIRRRRTGSMPTTRVGAQAGRRRGSAPRSCRWAARSAARRSTRCAGTARWPRRRRRPRTRASQRLHHHASLAPAITPAYLRSLGANRQPVSGVSSPRRRLARGRLGT